MAIETIERDCQVESEATPAPATIQYWNASSARGGVAPRWPARDASRDSPDPDSSIAGLL